MGEAMNTQLYDAMVARYGKAAVDAALDNIECHWEDDSLCTNNAIADVGYLPDPAATVLLCDVAEGLLWKHEKRWVEWRPILGESWWAMEVKEPSGCGASLHTGWLDGKPAAVLAALTAEAK